MTNAMYLATMEAYTGKSLVSLGLVEMILRKTARVAIFRPVISGSRDERDKNIDLLLQHFQLDQAYDETYAFTRAEAAQLLSHGRYDDALDKVFQSYKALEERYDFILVIGSDLEGVGALFEYDINADIARNLGTPVMLVGTAADRGVAETVNTAGLSVDHFRDRGCQIVGVIINRAAEEDVSRLRAALQAELGDKSPFVFVIPANQILRSPTVAEIVEFLDAEVLYGHNHLDRLAKDYLVVAMQLPNFLSHLFENALLITPGDRCDVLLSALQAHMSNNYPQLTGILLTTEQRPPQAVTKLLDGLNDVLPIIAVDLDTYDTATRIGRVRSYLTGDNRAKIDLSLKLFEDYVDLDALEGQISMARPRAMTPKMFIYNLLQQARSQKQHIVLPEGNDPRILRAAEVLLNRGVVDITLLGNPDDVQKLAHRQGVSIDFTRTRIINPVQAERFDAYAEKLYELRRHKNMTLDQARDLMSDVSYFGTMMVFQGDADGMVSGAAHTTMHTIRPALQFVKTKPGFSVISSVFFMALEDRVLVYGDCAVNPNPNAEELAEIAVASADTAMTFGVEPRIAMLSYSSGASGEGEDVERVRTATKLAQERRPDLLIEGPIQYDAAVDPGVAAKKMPGSRVAGQATVFIFPDLNTGNNTYKAVQRETGAIAIGPVLQGLRKPVNDLSRGCTVDDIINTVAITAVQAQQE
ncbi:MAG: phosphate acetyltransferase [Caldilineaceae bacterium]|nr:phosphate acetyltransferase [Caldilineaceae bacterium]